MTVELINIIQHMLQNVHQVHQRILLPAARLLRQDLLNCQLTVKLKWKQFIFFECGATQINLQPAIHQQAFLTLATITV